MPGTAASSVKPLSISVVPSAATTKLKITNMSVPAMIATDARTIAICSKACAKSKYGSLRSARSRFDAVWTLVEPDYRHLNARKLGSVRVALASAVLAYTRLGIRDPLVLRAMALGIIKRPVQA